MAADQYDLVIVGMGSAGMMAAEFAATLELRVALVEAGRIGGDRLWTGGVPSKALCAAARVAHTVASAGTFGVDVHGSSIDLERVWQRVREVQQRIAEADDDLARVRSLGLELIRGRALLTGPNEVTVTLDDVIDGPSVADEGAAGSVLVLQTRFVLLCAGSRPAVPDVAGLADVPMFTSETFFELDRPPASLVVLGGGPMGVELAQACVRLGITVTLVQRDDLLLPRDEPSLSGQLAGVLRNEGVEVLLGTEPVAVRRDPGRPDETAVMTVRTMVTGVERELRAGGVLIAAGRRPNVDDLGLEQLGIEVRPDGIVVDDRGRTMFRSVYAVGDVAAGERFTHAAGHAAVQAVRDMFFPGRSTMSELVPWCTFTDPELAHVGLTSGEAEARFGDDVDVWRIELDHNDRARIDGTDTGALVMVTAKDRIVGAHLLAPSAGEVIHELALAVEHGMKLGDLASLVHVYPTIASTIGRLASEFDHEKAQRYRWLVRRR